MADAPAPSPKLCSICGLDCSNKQRTKDAQGKYICAECIEHAKKARAAQQTPKPATPPASAAAGGPPKTVGAGEAENAFLLDIPGPGAKKVDANTKPCPSCFKPMEENTLVCMNCGFNTKTGEQLKVRVIKAKEEPTVNTDRQRGYSLIADIPDWAWVLAIATLGTIPLGIGLMLENPLVFALGCIGFVIAAVITEIWMLVNAFRSSTGMGLLYLLTSFICFGYIIHWWYVLTQCENSGLKGAWITSRLTGTALGLILQFNPAMVEFLDK